MKDTRAMAYVNMYGVLGALENLCALDAVAREILAALKRPVSLCFDVKDGPFDAVMLQEEIAKGQRVERFRIEVSDDGRTWETAAEGTTIGYKRIVRLPEARTARKLRVTIDGTRAPARISHVGLYLTE